MCIIFRLFVFIIFIVFCRLDFDCYSYIYIGFNFFDCILNYGYNFYMNFWIGSFFYGIVVVDFYDFNLLVVV